MKIFNCDCCGHPVFFENVRCLHCGCQLAFVVDQLAIVARQPLAAQVSGAALWKRHGDESGKTYRMCHNHDAHRACNFAVPAEDSNYLCVSCRQTRLLPDLSSPGNKQRWYHVEVAKRRLFYTLARLGLVATEGVWDASQTPVYEFLADIPGLPPVMTGHKSGVVTLNVAEADDDERVRRRVALREPYRTLLGHLRHESGHFYWDRLIRDQYRSDSFRALFGDESADYGGALQAHYAGHNAHVPWKDRFVSAYATAHPWEDWAETWAHYLHMVDLLETASSYHTTVVVPGGSSVSDAGVTNPFHSTNSDFEQLVAQWVPVTLLLNSLNRSLGQNDAYPFALSAGALHKLRYVHDVIHSAGDIVPDPGTRPAPSDGPRIWQPLIGT